MESIYDRGKVTILAIHDKPIPANGPYFEKMVLSTPSRIPEILKEKAIEYVSRIHHRLGENAFVLHTELRTLKDDVVLVEFGARLGGGPIYRSVLNSTGIDFLLVLIDLGLGNSPQILRQKPRPTLTHYLWAKKPGIIQSYSGVPVLLSSPWYCEHQIYDDVGKIAKRAPLSSRAQGYVCYRGESFGEIEKALMTNLEKFKFETLEDNT